MKTLKVEQMEQIEGGGCLEYVAGIALIVAGGLTGNPALGYIGLVVGINNSRSCAEEIT